MSLKTKEHKQQQKVPLICIAYVSGVINVTTFFFQFTLVLLWKNNIVAVSILPAFLLGSPSCILPWPLFFIVMWQWI